jgi:hypothetical protein
MEYIISDKVVGELPAFIIAGSGKCGSTTLVGVFTICRNIYYSKQA